MLHKYVSIQSKRFWNKKYPLFLWNISKNFATDNMKKKTELNGHVSEFSVDYDIIDTSNIINIHKYLIKKHDIK